MGSSEGRTVEGQNRGAEEPEGRRDAERLQEEEELMRLVFLFGPVHVAGGNLLPWSEVRALQPDTRGVIFGPGSSVSGPTTGGTCDYLQVPLNLPELLFPLCACNPS